MNYEYLNSLIESIIQEELLDEVAQTIDSSEQSGLALAKVGEGFGIEFILYDPKLVSSHNKQNPVLGSITINKIKHIDNCWKTSYSVAKKGYGPIMYEIAMSYISPAYLRADTLFVSDAARKVWDFFLKNRKDEFQIEKLSYITPDYPPAEESSGNELERFDAHNYAFAIKETKNYSKLIKNHEQFAKQLGMPEKQLESSLEALSNDLFGKMF